MKKIKILFKKKRLMYFLYFIFFSFQLFIYSESEDDIYCKKLDKYKSANIESRVNCFYLDLAEFKNEDYLYFKIDVEYGFFVTQSLFFGIFSKIPSRPSVSKRVKFCSENKGKIYSGDIYYSYSYSYKIPKPKDNYIIVGIPTIKTKANLGSALIKNSELECEGIIPDNYYLDGNTGEYNECYDTCKKCSEPGNIENNNCDECKTNYIFLDEPLINKKNCLKKCDYYYYFNESNNYTCTTTKSCPESYKLIEEKKKCVNECINDKDNKYIYEYNNKCVEQCPSDLKIDNEENKCLESCDEYKFEYENTCITNCPNSKYKIYTDRKICSDKIPENYYLDNITKIYKPCHDNCLNCSGPGYKNNNNCLECKQNFISIDKPNKGKHCLNCQYNYYIYNQNYFCTENSTCPEDHSKIIKEKNQCIDNCINDDIYQYEYNNRCYKMCPNGTNYINNNKICYDNDETIESIIQNEISRTREYLKSGKMNSTDYIMNIFNVSIQITNSENQKNNNQKNMSSIDLDKCENELRSIYGINDTFPLIIFKIDYFSNYSLIPIIGYEIYNPNNLLMLNLSYCTNNTIKVNIPANIDENNLFKYDPSNSFYKNNCHSYTTENGTDISLKDRQKEYKDKNMSLCENKCKYLGYDLDNKQSSCICEIKNQMETISEIKDNPKKLSDDFSENKQSSSSTMISTECAYVLFSVDGIKTNISSYLLLIIIFYFLSSILLFIKCGFPLLKEKIQKIINSKNKNSHKKIKNSIKHENNITSSKKVTNFSVPPKKNNNRNIINKGKIQNLKRVSKSNHRTKNLKKKSNKKIKNVKKEHIKNKNNNIINNFNEYELNSMDYEDAIKYDKRSFCEYYISLLKRKHPLLFGFCPFKDYNSIIIKSCIFFLSFGIYYAINFVFFNENMIHEIYEDGGKYNILYFLPIICISFAISHILTIIIKFLFLSERNLYEIKKQITYSMACNLQEKVERNLIIKYIIFFIMGIIFLSIFWLFLSSFGAVFQNTQIILVENTLISFGISFIYPFFINIIPGIFRICSLSDKKNNSICLYKISQFLQLL